jgi:hypothetical protein
MLYDVTVMLLLVPIDLLPFDEEVSSLSLAGVLVAIADLMINAG